MKRFYLIILITLILVVTAGCGNRVQTQEQDISAPPDEAMPSPAMILISELMPSNHASLSFEDGQFTDWIELINLGEDDIDLSGYTLISGTKSGTFTPFVLPPGEYVVFACSEKYSGNTPCIHCNLPKSGSCLAITDEFGRIICQLDYPELARDISYSLDFNSYEYFNCEFPTPGYENTESGREAFLSSSDTDSPLIINEVMVYNEWFSHNGLYFDWVELKNISENSIRLSDFYLSDDKDDRAACRLPEKNLNPGECAVIYCSDDPDADIRLNLNAQYDTLYLSSGDSSLCDFTVLRNISYGGSYGRSPGLSGFCYFSNPSPGEDNPGGCRYISALPEPDISAGVYECTQLDLELSGKGRIYYTLDCSTPSETSASSFLYSAPLSLTETSVVRAVCYEDGKLPSEVLTLSYILNEGHTLPVVSLVSDDGNLWGTSGIYSHPTEDWERPASISYFNGDESFILDCGIKIHGATSRIAQSKKSFKINFRSRYDGELNFNLFDNGIDVFSSVLLRSAQEDTHSTQMRDILMHQLAMECCPDLPTQDYRYVILYLNGEYWGLYAFREAHSAEHYARHYGYNPDTVVMWKEVWDSDSYMQQVYQYMLNHDMADDDNYAYVASHIDVDSLITWCIIEAYSGNLDLNSPNVRFYYSSEDEVMRFALVDLDLSMYPATGSFISPFYSGYAFSKFPAMLKKNAQFRELFLTRMSEYLSGPLSNEHVLEMIDSLASEIEPEIPRDMKRWGGTASYWYNTLDNYLRQFVTCCNGRTQWLIDDIDDYLYLSAEEEEFYFGNIN